MNTYTLDQVAAKHLPREWKNPERWLRERLHRGEITGKQITRGVWVMTDADIDRWINTRPEVAVVEPAQEEVVSIADGLSRRARGRATA